MPRPAPITAILYHDGREADPLMRALARHLAAAGLSLAGFVQHEEARPGRSRCDMVLEDLASGARIGISQDRGEGARGCRLDVGELLRGVEMGARALANRPDLLILNKFGKAEGEGGGFRDLIADAVEREVPVLVAVSWRNIDGWRRFAGPTAVEFAIERLAGSPIADVAASLGLSADRDRAAPRDDETSARPA